MLVPLSNQCDLEKLPKISALVHGVISHSVHGQEYARNPLPSRGNSMKDYNSASKRMSDFRADETPDYDGATIFVVIGLAFLTLTLLFCLSVGGPYVFG